MAQLDFSNPCPLLGDAFRHKPWYVNLSEDGPYVNVIKTLSQPQLDAVIKAEQRDRGVAWSISGERELRQSLYSAFGLMEPYIHIGIDVNVPAGTFLYAPFDSKIAQVHYDNEREGNGGFGGWTILEVINRGFYLMFGHLQASSFGCIGAIVKAGERFAIVADFHENGNWFHHAHMQVLTQKAYDEGLIWGFVPQDKYSDIDEYSPSPMSIIEACWGR